MFNGCHGGLRGVGNGPWGEDEPDCKPEERQQQWYDWEGHDRGTFVCKRSPCCMKAMVNGNHFGMSTVVPPLALLLTYRNFLDQLRESKPLQDNPSPWQKWERKLTYILNIYVYVANYVVLCLHRSIMHLDSLISKSLVLLLAPRNALLPVALLRNTSARSLLC